MTEKIILENLLPLQYALNAILKAERGFSQMNLIITKTTVEPQ